jgi:hypothetical protein
MCCAAKTPGIQTAVFHDFPHPLFIIVAIAPRFSYDFCLLGPLRETVRQPPHHSTRWRVGISRKDNLIFVIIYTAILLSSFRYQLFCYPATPAVIGIIHLMLPIDCKELHGFIGSLGLTGRRSSLLDWLSNSRTPGSASRRNSPAFNPVNTSSCFRPLQEPG